MLWLLQKHLNPHSLCGFLCALHRKSTTGRGFDAPTKEAAELTLQKMGQKRHLEMGFIFDKSRAVFVLHSAAQLCHKWVKLVQGFSAVQALHNSLVLRKKSLTQLLGLSHPAVTGIAMKCEGRALFLSKWWLLPIDRQSKAWLVKAMASANWTDMSHVLFSGRLFHSCCHLLCTDRRLALEVPALIWLGGWGRQQHGFLWTTLGVCLCFQPVLEPTPRFIVFTTWPVALQGSTSSVVSTYLEMGWGS